MSSVRMMMTGGNVMLIGDKLMATGGMVWMGAC